MTRLVRRLPDLFLAALLLASPLAAEATQEATPASEQAPGPTADPSKDDTTYAAREAKSAEAADFKGGSDTIVIGAGTLVVILLVVLIVVAL